MANNYERLGLKYNPFEPAASGIPVSGELWIPERWKLPIQKFLDTLQHTPGPKAFAILGEYGSGKSYLLQWLAREELPKESRRIQPFLFDNPGVQFYDLANQLFRQVGREEFAKSLWEFLSPILPGYQPSFFDKGFRDWLFYVWKHRRESDAIRVLSNKIQEYSIATDEEIRHKLARLLIETYDKPYFEYKDFVAGKRGSLVAEGEEAPYFAAVLRALKLTGNAESIAFLIDEFEEISLQKRLTKRQAHEYLATMKRLLRLTEKEQFWIFVAMTPQAAEVTEKLEPALWQRFISQGEHKFEIPPLNDNEVINLIGNRLKQARINNYIGDELYPFPENLTTILREDIKSSPRRLVKVCSISIARAVIEGDTIKIPFSENFLEGIQQELYPFQKTDE